MAGTRNEALIKDELVRYISSLGLEVKTATKARGNRGFFKVGRIDVSKTLDDKTAVKTIVHEFSHYVHYKLDKSLKSLSVVMLDDNDDIRRELMEVTYFVDENALCKKLTAENEKLKNNIRNLTDTIRRDYPEFNSNDDLKEFRQYSRWSDLKYLEKYDRVKIQSFSSDKVYSVANIKEDFPDIPDVFIDYLNLKSQLRRRAKISRRITRLNKYYNEPCELFARFIEGIYLDMDKVKELAPNAFDNFLKLYGENKYSGMREVFSILRVII